MSTSHTPPDLRALVAQVVREVVTDAGTPRSADAPRLSGSSLSPSGPLNAASRVRSDTVRITNDADLQRFVRRLLELFENPKTREDVRHGRLTFVLAGGVAAATAPGAVERIDRGAVTERRIAAAATIGARLVLGPRAVLTPLAREKAKALGVPIEKERT